MTTVNDVFSAYKIALSSEEDGLFNQYLKSFIEYNSHTNLSAIRDEEGIVEKHFADSAILANFESLSGRLLDIGTGGGFPWIPLKILFPALDVTLLDSVSKKTKACDYFIQALDLKNIKTIWGRAEEIVKQPWMMQGFDIITSRATAYFPQILEWALPFLAPHGKIYLYKSPSEEEMKDALVAIKRQWLRIEAEHEYLLANQQRKIFVITRKK